MTIPVHAGCFYCGSKSQQYLLSIVKPTIEVDGTVNRGHTTGQALCDACVNLKILDLRVPLAERRHV